MLDKYWFVKDFEFRELVTLKQNVGFSMFLAYVGMVFYQLNSH